MKPNKYVAVFSLLTALALCLTHSPVNAQHSDKQSPRGGEASTHMSGKGSSNSNAQWSADPERGWIRADERHQGQDESQVTGKSKPSRSKQKGNAAKEKSHN